MNIFIGCSARENIDTKYKESSKDLVEKVAQIKNLNLVFGAYYKGLMAICYDCFKQNNKKVIGVTPEIYKDALNEMSCDEEIITKTTMERFNEIYKKSDIFLFLPGGIGTLAELFNAMEENRTNDIDKKIILYNKDFFYTPIIKELYNMYKEKFIDLELSKYIIIESNLDNVIKLIKEEINKYE